MFFGREVVLPIDLMVPPPEQTAATERCPQEYVEWVRSTLQNAHTFARVRLRQSAVRQKRLYDRTTRSRAFPSGTWVWRYYPPTAGRKLGEKWRGPYLVLGRLGQTVYEIQRTESERPIRVHVDHLKACEGVPERAPWEFEPPLLSEAVDSEEV
jgi:hypothetical protein